MQEKQILLFHMTVFVSVLGRNFDGCTRARARIAFHGMAIRPRGVVRRFRMRYNGSVSMIRGGGETSLPDCKQSVCARTVWLSMKIQLSAIRGRGAHSCIDRLRINIFKKENNKYRYVPIRIRKKSRSGLQCSRS